MTRNLIERPDGNAISVLELENIYCSECDLYKKADLEIRELDICWKCHEYRRIGKVET